jgi:hypothetical protein
MVLDNRKARRLRFPDQNRSGGFSQNGRNYQAGRWQRGGIAMRGAAASVIALSFFGLCSCTSELRESAIKAEQSASKTEQSIAARCRTWEDRARKAARPDADMIAQHERLLAKAAKFSAEAQTHYNDTVVRQTAIENQAQAEVEADAIYDWKGDLKLASDCWDELTLFERQQRDILAALGANPAAQEPASSPPSTYMPPDLSYTQHVQPPSPPSPMPVPNLGSVYYPPAPPPAQTPADRLRDCAQTSSCAGAFGPYGNQ